MNRRVADIAILGSVLILVTALSAHRLADIDFFWQSRLGEEILSRGIPTTESWMYTRPGVETFSLSWAYCVALRVVEVAGGIAAVNLAKIAILLATFVLAWRLALRYADAAVVAAVTVIASLAMSQRFVARPEIVSNLLLMLLLLVLDRDARRPRSTFALAGSVAAIMAVWVNVHSMFALGLGVIAWWWALAFARAALVAFAGSAPKPLTRSLQRPTLVLVAAIAACFASPYWHKVWSVPYRRALALLPDPALRPVIFIAAAALVAAAAMLPWIAAALGARWRRLDAPRRNALRRRIVTLASFAVFGAMIAAAYVSFTQPRASDIERQAVTELMPLWQMSLGYTATRFAWLLIAVDVAAAAWCLRRRASLDLFWSGLLLGAIALGILTVRSLSLTALISIPFITMHIARASVPAPARPTRRINTALALAALALAATQIHALVTDRFRTRELDTRQFGLGIAEHEYPRQAVDLIASLGPGVHAFHNEKTGSYMLWRHLPVFIDSRAVGGILFEYLPLRTNTQLLREAVARHGITAAIIDTAEPSMARRFAKELQWRLVHLDETAAVFLAPGAGTPVHVPTLDLNDAPDTPWRRELAASLPAPNHASFWSLDRTPNQAPYVKLGQTLLALDKPNLAAGLLAMGADAAQSKFAAPFDLALALDRSGQLDSALKWYQHACAQAPEDCDVLSAAASAFLRAGQRAPAIELAGRVLARQPGRADMTHLMDAARSR